MHPDRATLNRRTIPSRTPRDEVVEPEMAQLMAGIAVNTTGRDGRAASSARSVSSQHTIPPPRSAVDCHHELRGVITTSGATVRLFPAASSETTMLRAEAVVRRLSETSRAGLRREAAASTPSRAALDTWIVGMPNGSRKRSALSSAMPGLGPAHRMTKAR
jgi:hypothetical protein